jgi:transposase
VSLPPKNESHAERLNSSKGSNDDEQGRASYTLEFKLEAVRLVKAGQSVAAVGATLGVPAQSISNWLKAEQEGKPGGAGAKPVSAEQMELARLRAEVTRLKIERDILKRRSFLC